MGEGTVKIEMLFEHRARIVLGAHVKDVVTGFEGVAAGVCFHMTGCTRYWVEGPIRADGKSTEVWVDEARLQTLGTWVDLEHPDSPDAPSNCAAPNVGPSKP